jgi:hypothetical protein
MCQLSFGLQAEAFEEAYGLSQDVRVE